MMTRRGFLLGVAVSVAAGALPCRLFADGVADSSENHAGPVRVLTVGNSFSDSLLTDFPGVAESLGVKLDFTSLYIGGCSLRRHVENLRRDGERDFAPYSLMRVVCGKRLPERKANLGEVLRKEKYDIITMHQASPDSWCAETYAPAGDELLAAIRKWQPQAKVLVQETWSYTPWDARLAQWGITADEMYAGIHRACTAFAARHGLHVIPMGAGVERWRRVLPVRYAENSFGGDLCGGRWRKPEEMFVRTATGSWRPAPKCDVFHLNERGEYFQALLWTADLFHVDARRCAYAPKALDEATAIRIREVVMETLEGSGNQ